MTTRSATTKRTRSAVAPEQVAGGMPHAPQSVARPDRQVDLIADDDHSTLGVADAARLLGRDCTRVYALLRSGDLVAAPAADGEDDQSGPVRVVRASVERWLVA